MAQGQKQTQTWERHCKILLLTARSKRSKERRLNSPTMAAPAAKSILPTPSSLPLQSHRTLEIKVQRVHFLRCHVTFILNDEVFSKLQTDASWLKCRDASRTLKQPCCFATNVSSLSVIAAKWIPCNHPIFCLFLQSVIYSTYSALFCALSIHLLWCDSEALRRGC